MALLTPDVGFLFWHSVIFLITLLVLGRFAWKPILSIIKERENVYAEAVEEMKEAQQALKSLEEKKAQLLAEAETERGELLAEAMAHKEALVKQATQEALVEKKRLIAQAERIIALEQEKAQEGMKQEMVAMIIHTTQKLLSNKLQAQETQQQLIEEMIREVEAEQQNP